MNPIKALLNLLKKPVPKEHPSVIVETVALVREQPKVMDIRRVSIEFIKPHWHEILESNVVVSMQFLANGEKQEARGEFNSLMPLTECFTIFCRDATKYTDFRIHEQEIDIKIEERLNPAKDLIIQFFNNLKV